jgi:hypothetical protein
VTSRRCDFLALGSFRAQQTFCRRLVCGGRAGEFKYANELLLGGASRRPAKENLSFLYFTRTMKYGEARERRELFLVFISAALAEQAINQLLRTLAAFAEQSTV